MGRKFVPISKGDTKYRLYLTDIKKIHKSRGKSLPPVPDFEKKDVSSQ